MKNKLINRIAMFGLITLIVFLVTKGLPPYAKAQNQERKSREVVILWGDTDTIYTNSAWFYDGMSVYASSSSSGAPHFQQAIVSSSGRGAISMAEAIAICLREGFEIKTLDPYGRSAVLVK